MYLHIVIVWIAVELGSAKSPGIQRQTVGGKQYPHEAIQRLFKVFGISRVPDHLHHSTPPQYMTDLFRSVAYDDGISKKSAPYNANTVRGFPDRGTY